MKLRAPWRVCKLEARGAGVALFNFYDGSQPRRGQLLRNLICRPRSCPTLSANSDHIEKLIRLTDAVKAVGLLRYRGLVVRMKLMDQSECVDKKMLDKVEWSHH